MRFCGTGAFERQLYLLGAGRYDGGGAPWKRVTSQGELVDQEAALHNPLGLCHMGHRADMGSGYTAV